MAIKRFVLFVCIICISGCRPADVYDLYAYIFNSDSAAKSALEMTNEVFLTYKVSYSPHKLRPGCDVRDFINHSHLTICQKHNILYVGGALNPGNLTENRNEFNMVNQKIRKLFEGSKIEYQEEIRRDMDMEKYFNLMDFKYGE